MEDRWRGKSAHSNLGLSHVVQQSIGAAARHHSAVVSHSAFLCNFKFYSQAGFFAMLCKSLCSQSTIDHTCPWIPFESDSIASTLIKQRPSNLTHDYLEAMDIYNQGKDQRFPSYESLEQQRPGRRFAHIFMARSPTFTFHTQEP